ncbi:Uridylate kinase [Candidatus Bandiella woodruffii]|uniref:Uridylate kinase n=2 Tax=Candidatus Bandiella euplotis TaxID=1664265 RepID=A0ABZ0UMT1_9RICK|nr:UMP kinase [Candidatus Bandiella woodruffii]WPX96254.1 Uridylate kinase [Candidatus Bandiella woodruffii]
MKKSNRILLKISGEALMGQEKFGHDNSTIDQICEDIKEVYDLGYEVCLVVGGGNICRGAAVAEVGIERATADYMGMLATVINAIALQSKLESKGLYTRVISAIPIVTIVEQYIRRKAIRHLEKKRVVIFASGTGNPFFTTDTCAVLRAIEMDCSFVLKGTLVDGVYSEDPKHNPNALKYEELSYNDVIKHNLAVMDTTAITLARDNHVSIKIFNINKKGEFAKVLKNTGDFTTIK